MAPGAFKSPDLDHDQEDSAGQLLLTGLPCPGRKLVALVFVASLAGEFPPNLIPPENGGNTP